MQRVHSQKKIALPEKAKEYQLILWDWNGTLLNDAPLCHRTVNLILHRYGLPQITFSQYQLAYRHPFTEMYASLGFEVTSEAFVEVLKEWHTAYDSALQEGEVRLHQDAIDILSRMQSRGVLQAILSAHQQDRLHQQVAQFGIAHFFEEIFGLVDNRGDCKRGRGQNLLSKFHIDPELVLLIGDSSHDAEVAQFLNIDCVLVSRGSEDAERLGRHDFPVYTSLVDVAAHF